MRLLLLLLAAVALAVRPAPASKSTLQFTSGLSVPQLTGSEKMGIEKTILAPWFSQQQAAGTKAYAGVTRLCFHDAGTYDPVSGTGGAHAWGSQKCNVSDACEYTSVDNAGLPPWMDALDNLYDDYALSNVLTRADFWHLTCNFAIELASGFAFKIPFQAGRTDPPPTNTPPRFNGTLPKPSGFSEVVRVFINRLGFSYEDSVALMGAHTLGGCTIANTGYLGTWDSTSNVWDNKYFSGLINLQWLLHPMSPNGTSGTESASNKVEYSLGGVNYNRSVMLMTDMGLLYNLSGHCNVTNSSCPLNNLTAPYIFAFANSQTAFFNAFIAAFVKLQVLGCNTCYDVPWTGCAKLTTGPLTTSVPLPIPQQQPPFEWLPVSGQTIAPIDVQVGEEQ